MSADDHKDNYFGDPRAAMKRLRLYIANSPQDFAPKPLLDADDYFGYSRAAINQLRLDIAKARQDFAQAPAVYTQPLSLAPDRTKTAKELTEQLVARLAEIGLKPQDVLLRFVRGQGYVHTPTARTIGENDMLAMELGVSAHDSTWASQFYEKSTMNMGADCINSGDYAYMVLRASHLIRIDRVGDTRVDRPFYVFKGLPQAAFVAKIFDGGTHKLAEPINAAPTKPAPESASRPTASSLGFRPTDLVL